MCYRRVVNGCCHGRHLGNLCSEGVCGILCEVVKDNSSSFLLKTDLKIQGEVVNSLNEPIEGIEIVMELSTGQIIKTKINQNGKYEFIIDTSSTEEEIILAGKTIRDESLNKSPIRAILVKCPTEGI